MRLLVNIFCLLVAITPTLLLAQNFPSRNFSTSDGLSNDAVRSLFIDSKDKLWIGTENGISIYEGGVFTNLYKEDGLAQNSCWGICEDIDNNMWFASYGGGVTKFDGKKYKVFTTLDGLAHNKTRKVFSYKNKVIVGTEYGISIIDISSNAIITPKEVFPHFGVFIVTDIFEYKGEIYFSALNEGFFKLINFTVNPKVIPVLLFQTCYSVGNFQDRFYNSNKGFLDVLEFTSRSVKRSSQFGQSIAWQYAKDKRNTIYAACWGIFDSSGGLYEIQVDEMRNLSEQFGIDSKKLLNVVYDKTNDFLYVGSKDRGFYEIQLDQAVLFEKNNRKKVLGFEDNLVLDQGGVDFIWQNNVVKSIKRSEFKAFQSAYSSKNRIEIHSENRDNFELNFNLKADDLEFYDLKKHRNAYYISSNIGIFEVNQNAEIQKYFPIHTYNFGFTTDNLFFESHPYGPTKIYKSLDSLEVKQVSKEVSDIVSSINVNGSTYFLSVFSGLSAYSKGIFRSFLKEGLFLEDKLKHSAKNDKGELIVSSEFGDVFIIKDLKTFKNVLKIPKEIIVGNSINFLESYKDFIIIGTEKGINIYKDGIIQLIDKDQGVINCTFKSSKIIEKTLYVGNNEGYFKFNLEELILPKTEVSELKITKILINNKEIDGKDFRWFNYTKDYLETSFDENTLSINFIAKGSAFPQKLKYRYRLENDNQWSPYSEKANVFLPYLPFGDYNLEIEVYDLNSGRSKIFTILKIKVLAPFYYQWWFLLITFLVVSSIAVFSIKRFKTKSKEKALVQKRIAETKLEALLSQMNPHFMFNAMNAIQNYVISNDTLNSLHYIGEFAKLMRKTLENSSKPKISLKEEIDYLRTYISIENMRFNHGVKVEILTNETLNLALQIPTMLLQPFVENVFVHAFTNATLNPTLTIEFAMLDKTTLQTKIVDNGKGIHKNSTNLHHSKGILLARERLSLLQNDLKESIKLESNFPFGTQVVVKLQVKTS